MIVRNLRAVTVVALVLGSLLGLLGAGPLLGKPAGNFATLSRVLVWKVNLHVQYSGSRDGQTVRASSDWVGQLRRIDPNSNEDFSWNADLPVRVHGTAVVETSVPGHHDIKTSVANGVAPENAHLILSPEGYEFGFGHSQIKATQSVDCSRHTCEPDVDPYVEFCRPLTIRQPLPTQGKSLAGSGTYNQSNSDAGDPIPPGYTMSVTWSFVPVSDDLEAVPVVASTVERGETLLLDGRQSTGHITDYKWTLTPRGGGAKTTTKSGASTQVVPLDGLEVKLTVSDGRKTSSRAVSVSVTPRASFRTRFEHTAREGTLPDGTCPSCAWTGTDSGGQRTYYGEWVGGENVCAIDPPAAVSSEAPHILHPKLEGAGKDDLYTLVPVKDPKGPWDGFYYFKDWKVEVKRQIRVNRFLLENGPPLAGASKNFYQANLERHHDVKGYLAAVRKHEQTHSDLMSRALSERDPARETEKAFGKDPQKLRDEANVRLREAGKFLHDRAKDPLEELWKGDLAVPRQGTLEWRTFPLKVGGPGYGSF